jgi:hypothetical protein
VLWHFNPHRIEEDDAADTRSILHCHLRCDPLADRVPDDSHLLESKVVEQGGLERGEPCQLSNSVGRAVPPNPG